MYEVRSLFVDTFGAYNGGNTARYNSVGYYTAQGAEACDDTWVEIDSLPDSTPFAEVFAYVTDLNTQAPTVEEVTPEEELPTHPNAAYYASLGITQDSPEVTGAWGDEEEEEGTPEGTADNPSRVFEEVREDKAPGFGLFVFRTIGGQWHASADLPNVRTYLSAPYRTEEEARAEVRRIAPMYPRLKWYRVIA